ncbi:MAG TPA: hypothetical protein DEP76_11650 [Alteromonas sp.]|nr:hypothetical protein [Alteromonas sp.]HCB17685.1 hypothetical protein [Alteromonas sp.]
MKQAKSVFSACTPGKRHTTNHTDNLQHSITIADIASPVGLSEFHFARAFRQSFYTSVHRYIESRRVQRVRELLTQEQKLVDIADAAGFSDQSHLSRVVKRQTGVTPKSLKHDLNNQPH